MEPLPQEERRQQAADRGVEDAAGVKASAKKAAKNTSAAVIDPYLPNSGNFGYHVSHYDLDLEYKVAINRLSGSATITAVALAARNCARSHSTYPMRWRWPRCW